MSSPDGPREDVLLDPAVEFGVDEAAAAKAHWAAIGVRNFYVSETHWSSEVADHVLAWGPRSVLEFGCNAGRNLVAIRDRDPEPLLLGLDINADAVAHGRARFGLNLRVADEGALSALRDGQVDVAFTISVLDHIPDPLPILRDLVRVSRLGVVLLEPYVGREGKVLRNAFGGGDRMVASTPFSYSWDFVRLIGAIPEVHRFQQRWYPLGETSLGRSYRLYRLERHGARPTTT